MRDLLGKFFAPPVAPVGPRDAIVWWEKRRLAFNLFVLAISILALAAFFSLASAVSSYAPEQENVSTAGLMADAIAFPIAVNVLYTLGWIIEAPLRLGAKRNLLRLGPVLLGIGIAASLLISLTPTLVLAATAVGHMAVAMR